MSEYLQPNPTRPDRARRKDRVAMSLVGIGTIIATVVMVTGMPLLADADKRRRPVPPEPIRSDQSSETLTPTEPGGPTSGVVIIDAFTPVGGATGTGMILPGTDQILTAYHVVEDAEWVEIEIADTGETYEVDLLGYSYERDIALLDIQGDNTGLPSVVLDEDGFDVGDDVLAVGNADGQGFLSEFPGEITNVSTYAFVMTDDGAPDEYFDGLVQTTASVVGGVSGGPLFDAENEVLGVVVIGGATDGPEGMAVSIDDATAVVDQVRAGDHSGTVRVNPTASLGIVTLNSRVDEDLASPVATQRVDGLMVWEFLEDSAAERAGIRLGDVITGFEGEPLMYASELSGILREKSPGDQVTLQLTREDGSTDEVEVELGERMLF